MHLHPEALPRKSENPAENQNEKNMVQRALVGRAPEGEMAWSKRYSLVFRELFSEDWFHDAVKEAHLESDPERRNALLTNLQEALDADLAKNPRFDAYDDES